MIGSELISKVPQRAQCREQSIGGRVDPARPVRGHCSILFREEVGANGTSVVAVNRGHLLDCFQRYSC